MALPPSPPTAANGTTTSDHAHHSIRDRYPTKRNPAYSDPRPLKSTPDRPLSRPLRFHKPTYNKGLFFFCKGIYLLYFVVFFAVFAFIMASVLLQSSITSMVFSKSVWGSESRRSVKEGLRFGSSVKFVMGFRSRGFAERKGLDHIRLMGRVGLRPPTLCVVLGNLKKGPQSLMLFTVMKNIQKLGYVLKVVVGLIRKCNICSSHLFRNKPDINMDGMAKYFASVFSSSSTEKLMHLMMSIEQIYAIENGEARTLWQQIDAQMVILRPEQYGHVDWSIFDGVIVDSIEAKEAISSLMQEPFSSIPLVWIIQEDILASRLTVYMEMGLEHLISHWKSALDRASVVVFPDYTLPMLYSVLDTGNFFVIPGSPVDVWAAESYASSHAKPHLRAENGFSNDEMVVLVVGSSFFYDELSWDYAVAMHALGPLLVKYARRKDAEGSFKFVFLCGNSTDGDALQEVTSRLDLLPGSVKHLGLNGDANSLLLMADIVVFCSSQDEQGFPPLIIRAMTFGTPVVAPDIPILKKYIIDGVHGLLFPKYNPEALVRNFSRLVVGGKLSRFAQTVASSGRLLAKNLLAAECITSHARLLENVLSFPSDAQLPAPVSQLQQKAWEWSFLRKETERVADEFVRLDVRDSSFRVPNIVFSLEEKFSDLENSTGDSENGTMIVVPDIPTQVDWDVLEDINSFEEYERVEMEQLEERMDKSLGVWDDIYRNARKSEKLKFEVNERDEGELERTGQPVCIYEIYDGAGAWMFLHHGSLYRGLSLSTNALRSRSDDVSAVSRLPLLNVTYYRNILCEIGGMFSIANKVDNIHRRPWIGFQSWRASGRKVSLSTKAERALEQKILEDTTGDVIYFWARMGVDKGVIGSNDELTFWSTCDILNGGRCRTVFEDAFRRMYGLPSGLEALPPMPEDGGHWSTLHSWMMPTPSFLEFVMFSRMFVDSLDSLHNNSSKGHMCVLSSSELEEKHCYCRVLELLVNVWAYHSARKMVYIDPNTGFLEEQHPIDQRKGVMWAKYFDLTLLKSIDEDLAEAADDGDYPRERWLWPQTGEVHWQGIYEREREERYRLKMDKKRKTKEKLYERMKSGYKQKPLGGKRRK